jgi:hypothetical protein
VHLEGHFLGYQLLRVTRHPIKEMPGITAPLIRSLVRPTGAAMRERMDGLKNVISSILTTLRDPRQDQANDPVARTRKALDADTDRLQEVENLIRKEIETILSSALRGNTE